MTTDLLQYRKSVYSQSGQDGIIEHIFSVLGIKKGHFLEFGAWDRIYLSNCRKLYEEGWSGVFIEADDKKFMDLKNNYSRSKDIVCVQEMVEVRGSNRIDNVLLRCSPDKPLTFISVDTDGLDLEFFESIDKYLPVVACIEGGQGPHPHDPRMPYNCIHNVGQSLSVINEVAEKKGYKLICSFQDQFLIKKEFYNRFSVSQDIERLYLNGLKTQIILIPEFHRRLKRLHRNNKILDYILSVTDYTNYSDDKKWQDQNYHKILETIDSLPDKLLDVDMTKKSIFAISLLNVPVWFLQKRFSKNIFWKLLFCVANFLKCK